MDCWMEQDLASLEHSPGVAELRLVWVALTQALEQENTKEFIWYFPMQFPFSPTSFITCIIKMPAWYSHPQNCYSTISQGKKKENSEKKFSLMCFGFRVETFSDHFIVEPGGRIFRAFQGMLNPRDLVPWLFPWVASSVRTMSTEQTVLPFSCLLFSFLYLNGSNLSGGIFLKIWYSNY